LRIGPAPATMPACNPRGERPTVHRFRLAAMTTIALERGGFSPWWPVVAAATPVDTAIVPDGRPNGASIVLVVRRNDHSDRPRYRGHRSRPLTCTFAPPAGLEPAPYGLEVDPPPSTPYRGWGPRWSSRVGRLAGADSWRPMVPGGMTNRMTAPGFHRTVSSSGGALKAPACLGRHDGQRARRRVGIGSDLGQLLMKA
jgi:hypothetical protein